MGHIQAHHTARIPDVGRRLEEQAIDNAEHRRVGADAERQRDDRGDGQPRAPCERAQRVAQVGEQGVHARASALGARESSPLSPSPFRRGGTSGVPPLPQGEGVRG